MTCSSSRSTLRRQRRGVLRGGDVTVPVIHPKEADTAALLAELDRAGVRFIVVGGAAAQLHGSTLGTLDLDIVHQRSPANVAALLEK